MTNHLTLFTYSLPGEVGILIPIFQMSNWNSERLSHLSTVTQLVNDKFWLQTQLLLTPHLSFFSIMVCYQFKGDDKGGQAQALVESFSFQPSRTVRIITKSSFEIHITSVVKRKNFVWYFLTSVPLVLVMAVGIFKSVWAEYSNLFEACLSLLWVAGFHQWIFCVRDFSH